MDPVPLCKVCQGPIPPPLAPSRYYRPPRLCPACQAHRDRHGEAFGLKGEGGQATLDAWSREGGIARWK